MKPTINYLASGSPVELVGKWIDLALYWRDAKGKRYYQSSNGRAGFVCIGSKIQNRKGHTLDGLPLDTLPDLDPEETEDFLASMESPAAPATPGSGEAPVPCMVQAVCDTEAEAMKAADANIGATVVQEQEGKWYVFSMEAIMAAEAAKKDTAPQAVEPEASALPVASDGAVYDAAIRGTSPAREIPAAELPDYAGEQVWRVRLPLGFESNFYMVIGDGLCTADACDAVAEWLREVNPDYTQDWEALAESLTASPDGTVYV